MDPKSVSKHRLVGPRSWWSSQSEVAHIKSHDFGLMSRSWASYNMSAYSQKWNAAQTNRTIIRWFSNVVFECYFWIFQMVGSDYLIKPTDTVDKIFYIHDLRKSGASLSPPISMLSSKLCWRTLHIEYWVQIRVHSKPTLKSGGAGAVQRSHLHFPSNIMSIYNTLTRHCSHSTCTVAIVRVL